MIDVYHVEIDSKCVAIDVANSPYIFNVLVAPPIRLACMTESYVDAKIRRVKQDPRYTVLLQLQRLTEQPDRGADPAAEAAPQPSMSQEGAPLPSQPTTPEEEAVDRAGQKVLSATYVSSAEIDGKPPPYNKSLESVDLDFNRNYGYDNMAGIIRAIDNGALNGGWAPLVTQQRGSCLFHPVS